MVILGNLTKIEKSAIVFCYYTLNYLANFSLKNMKKRFIVLLAFALILPSFALISPAKAVGTPSLSAPAGDNVLTNYPRTVNYSWAHVSGATKYELEVACDVCVSKTNKWQGAKTYITYNESYNLTMPGDNQFRWRVRAYDAYDSAGYWSEYRYFTFKTGSSQSTALGIPVITEPYNGKNFSSGYVQINWTSVFSATSYNYEIQKYSTDSASWSYYSNNSTGSTSVYPSVSDGQYRVRVRAVNGSTSGA